MTPVWRFGCAESLLWCSAPAFCPSAAHRLRKRAFVCARETCAAACLWILQYLLAKVCLSEGATRLPRFLPRHRNRPIRELPCCPAAPSPNIRRTATTNIVFLSFIRGSKFGFLMHLGLFGVKLIWESHAGRRSAGRRDKRWAAFGGSNGNSFVLVCGRLDAGGFYFSAESCSAVSPVNSLICSAGIPAAIIFLATSALPSASPASARTRAPWRNSVCRPRTPASGGSSSSPLAPAR